MLIVRWRSEFFVDTVPIVLTTCMVGSSWLKHIANVYLSACTIIIAVLFRRGDVFTLTLTVLAITDLTGGFISSKAAARESQNFCVLFRGAACCQCALHPTLRNTASKECEIHTIRHGKC